MGDPVATYRAIRQGRELRLARQSLIQKTSIATATAHDTVHWMDLDEAADRIARSIRLKRTVVKAVIGAYVEEKEAEWQRNLKIKSIDFDDGQKRKSAEPKETKAPNKHRKALGMS